MADIERLVLNLHTMGEIKIADAPKSEDSRGFHNFLLNSKVLSPYYISGRDLSGLDRSLPLSLEEQLATRNIVVSALAEVIARHNFDHLYPLPQAATVLGSMVAHEAKASLLWGRVGNKAHGTGREIQGNFSEGDTVLALDNVITKGDTMIAQADKLASVGLRTSGLVVLVDREESGREALNAYKPPIKLDSVVGIGTVMDILAANGRVNEDQVAMVNKYRAETAPAPPPF